MPEQPVSKAVNHLLGLGDWRPKLRLAQLLNLVDTGIFASFRRDLIALQYDSGLFPLFWTRKEQSSLRYTAMAINCFSRSGDGQAAESVRTACRTLVDLQDVAGNWSERPEALQRLKPRQMHPGWSRGLDRAEISCLIVGALSQVSPNEVYVHAIAKGIEWLQRFLKEQEYETKRAGDEYSLNAWTLDLIVSSLLDSGVDSSKPSIDDAIHVLARDLGRALQRKHRNVLWSILAGTRTLSSKGGFEDLLDGVAAELARIQNRDGSWRLRSGSAANETGDWTLQALSFLVSQNPSNRQQCRKTVLNSLKLRDFVASTLEKNEERTRQVFEARFREVGVREGQPREHLLFASFAYSILEQFFWVTSEFDPQAEYLNLILQIGRLERVGLEAYTDSASVRRALFRSRSLRDQASARKGEVAQSISLFAVFLQSSRTSSFREFVLALRQFVLKKAPDLAQRWKRDVLLGEIHRLEAQRKDDPESLMKSLEDALQCFPGVGEKVSALFLYYAGHVFEVWEDLPKHLVDVPIDWNLVKPYAMLQLTSSPLDQLRKKPQLAATSIQENAREMFADDPGTLYGLWVVGHDWCARPWMCQDKSGKYCLLYAQCPYPRSRK